MAEDVIKKIPLLKIGEEGTIFDSSGEYVGMLEKVEDKEVLRSRPIRSNSLEPAEGILVNAIDDFVSRFGLSLEEHYDYFVIRVDKITKENVMRMYKISKILSIGEIEESKKEAIEMYEKAREKIKNDILRRWIQEYNKL